MELPSIGSLKAMVMAELVGTPVVLFAGVIEDIDGGILSAAVVVKVKVTAVLKGFPTRSVIPAVALTATVAPSGRSPATGIKVASLFAVADVLVPGSAFKAP
jgi:hypothetical protein